MVFQIIHNLLWRSKLYVVITIVAIVSDNSLIAVTTGPNEHNNYGESGFVTEAFDFAISVNAVEATSISVNDAEDTVYDDDSRRSGIPQLRGECAWITDVERENGLNMGSNWDCFSQVLMFEDLFANISDECLMCRCQGVECPYYTEEEEEAAWDRLTSDLDPYLPINKHTITYLVVFGTTILVGSIGNLLVIVTVVKVFRPISATNMFIASLALADFLVCSLIVPVQLYLFITIWIWKYSAVLCKLFHYAYYGFFMASVFSLTAMSLERFFVICYPMKAQSMSTTKRSRIIISALWPLALAMAIPVAFQSDKYRGHCEVRRDNHPDDWAGHLYMYMAVAVFAVPSAAIGYAYIRTSLVLWESIKKAKDMTNEKDDAKKKESRDVKSRIAVIRMLIVIWVIFIVCWGPYLILQVIDLYATDWLKERISNSQWNMLSPALQAMTMANSAINPVLYAFMSRQFRRGFMKCFLFCFKPIRDKTSTDSTSGFSRSRPTTNVTSVSATVAK